MIILYLFKRIKWKLKTASLRNRNEILYNLAIFKENIKYKKAIKQ